MRRRATADASEDPRISLLFHKHSKGLEWCFRISCRVMQGLDREEAKSGSGQSNGHYARSDQPTVS